MKNILRIVAALGFFFPKRAVVEPASNMQGSVFITYLLINPPFVLIIGHVSPLCLSSNA